MVGFVQNMPSIRKNEVSTLNHQRVQCLYGVQTKHYDVEEDLQVKTAKKQTNIAFFSNKNQVVPANSLLQVDTDLSTDEMSESVSKIFSRSSQTHRKRVNALLQHVPSDENDDFIQLINEGDFGWKADVCQLQTHHKDYAAHCNKPKGSSLIQESSNLQISAQSDAGSASRFGEDSEEFKKVLAKAQHWGKKYKTTYEIPDSEIPDVYDY